MTLLDIGNHAIISHDGVYRYRLTRRWAYGAPLVFVMLNPSTADAGKDDPTIRKCIGYARRERLSGIEVVNLFAFRATDPKALTKAVDPIGPDNAAHILDACHGAARIVAAWGKSIPAAFGRRPADVLTSIAARWHVYGLGKRDEAPAARHPLYLRGDAPFELLGWPS